MPSFPSSMGFVRGGRPIPIRLGQVPDVNVQAGGTLECYKCGIQGYRQMTAAMAAMVPGGCTKVDPSLCNAGTGTGTDAGTGTNPWGNTGGTTPIPGGGLAVGMGAGNLDVTFRVYRADKAKNVTGVRVAPSVVLASSGAVISTLPEQVIGENGGYLIHATSPAPKRLYSLKIVVTPEPGGIAFDKVTSTIPMLQPNEQLGSSALVSIGRAVVICPKDALPLVCEVGRKQLMYASIASQQSAAWNTDISNGFVSQFAHDQMAETDVSDPMLAKYWYHDVSYIVADLRIPPDDFPKLLKSYHQMKDIWNAIPWPGSGPTQALFKTCASGVLIHKNYQVFSGRLYAPSIESFFPKTDAEIRSLLATKFLSDLMGIYGCMEHKIEKKMESIKKHAKQAQIIGLVISLMTLGGGDFYAILGALVNAGITMNQFKTAIDFSKFMMGYNEFVAACAAAEKKDFTCEYMAPFILWCMEAIFMAEFLDYVAIKAGLPGAREGLTQEEVIKPMVQTLEGAGVNVPSAAQTPGGKVATTGQAVAAVAGIGVVSGLALLLFGGFRR